MSVVIVGGNERMERQYKDLCKTFRCNAKVYTKKSGMSGKVGEPDLLVLMILFDWRMGAACLLTAAVSVAASPSRKARSCFWYPWRYCSRPALWQTGALRRS